jgi:hypothetical protein
MSTTKDDADRIIDALERFAQRYPRREAPRAAPGTSSPAETLAELRDYGLDLEPGPDGTWFLVRTRAVTGEIPRWLRRHLAEHWDAICRLVNERASRNPLHEIDGKS